MLVPLALMLGNDSASKTHLLSYPFLFLLYPFLSISIFFISHPSSLLSKCMDSFSSLRFFLRKRCSIAWNPALPEIQHCLKSCNSRNNKRFPFSCYKLWFLLTLFKERIRLIGFYLLFLWSLLTLSMVSTYSFYLLFVWLGLIERQHGAGPETLARFIAFHSSS